MAQRQKTLKVTLVKQPDRHKAGAPRDGARPGPEASINQRRELEDTPAVRGMINKVDYLVKVERLRHANSIRQARRGLEEGAPPRRPRHRLGPGQDRRPRPQGPEVARSGGFHKVGFEGGQMPLQRRLPKRGFSR